MEVTFKDPKKSNSYNKGADDITIFGINGSWRSIVLLPLVIFYRKETNNERIDTDGFQSNSLMTAWEEIF